MQITIKTLKGETFPVEIESNASVSDLKNKIKQVKNFEVESQKIVFKGKATANNDVLDKIGVKDGDFLVIMNLVKVTDSHIQKPQPKNVEGKKEEKQEDSLKQDKTQKPNTEQKTEKNELQPAKEQFQTKVTNLMNMGFSRQKCEQALRAAFNNEDRAVEYLINGIPSSPVQPMQPEGGSGGLNFLGGVVNNPQFAQIRDMIRNDPSSLQPILEQIAQTSPQLYQIIAQHPQEFERLVMEEGEEGDQDFEGEQGFQQPGALIVTQQEEAAINRLVNLGFPKIEAAQAYIACEKNEELAANLLFDRLANGDFDQNGEGLPQEHGDDDEDNLFN